MRCMTHMQLYVGETTTEVLMTMVVQNWKKQNSFTYGEKLLKKLYSGLTHLLLACFSLHSLEKERNIWNPLSLNTGCRLQRHLWHTTATCSMYNYVVWVCTRATDLSCYLLMINYVIHYMEENLICRRVQNVLFLP